MRTLKIMICSLDLWGFRMISVHEIKGVQAKNDRTVQTSLSTPFRAGGND
jgi:hypothetical protein